MESNKALTAIIAIMLVAIALEGIFIIVQQNDSSTSNEYAAFEDDIAKLNDRGGKIIFNSGNTNEISPGSHCVSVRGSTVHISAHGTYKEVFCPISGISCIIINS